MLKGIAVSGGFAIGKILKLGEEKTNYNKSAFRGKEAESRRFESALCDFTARMEQIADSLRRIVGSGEADIFKGHIFIANDPDIKRQIKEKIEMGFNAEIATESACDYYIDRFLHAQEDVTRQRAADIKDVKSGFLNILCKKEPYYPTVPYGSVVAVTELTPSAVSFLDRRRTVAVLAQYGEAGSHPAILLRAMGIPAVLSIEKLMDSVHSGQKVIVDANHGEVIPIASKR